jgi:hypothetical protein
VAKKALFRSSWYRLAVCNFIDACRTNFYAVPAPIAFDVVYKYFYREGFLCQFNQRQMWRIKKFRADFRGFS